MAKRYQRDNQKPSDYIWLKDTKGIIRSHRMKDKTIHMAKRYQRDNQKSSDNASFGIF
jgi:hypothetical protein